jgi:hypothetical protein
LGAYFGKVLRDARPSTRAGRAAALTVYFQLVELRDKVDLHIMTGRVVECPLDEINRPRPRSKRSCASSRQPTADSRQPTKWSSCSPSDARSWSPAAG